MNYTITKAGVNDVEVIRRIAKLTYWPTYSEILKPELIRYMIATWYSRAEIARQIAGGTDRYILLNEGDKTVAFAAYSIDSSGIPVCRLQKLYCLPETQGKGYGRILIATVSRFAVEAGVKRLLLKVHRANKAVAFYQKMGFDIIQEECNSIGPFELEDYVMQKLLVS